MRTKALICLAVLAAGVATTMAQSNVYSLNIVGYVNYTQLPSKFNIIANPLNQTNNDVQYVFPNGATYPGLTVFKRNAGGGYDQATYDPDAGGWTAPLPVAPGDAIWLQTPTGNTYSNTFVGEVIMNSTNPIPAGFSLKASVVPQSGGLQTALGFPAAFGDTVYFWNGTGYDIYVNDPDAGGWTPGEPIPAVAQGFWVQNPGAAKDWIRNFTP